MTVIAVTMISLPWLKKDFEIPKPIMVEFVEIGKVTETNKVSTAPAKKAEEKKPKDAPPPPAPKNTSKAPTPPPPKKDTAKDEPKKDTKKDTTAKTDPAAKPDKKKPEKKPEKEKAAEPERDFNSVLVNLAKEDKTKPTPAQKQPDMGLDEAAPQEGANAPLGQKMTMSEEDALRRQLEGCWNFPYGAKDAEDLNVEIFMVINPDRTLREARVVDQGRYNRDSFFRAAADSAMRAVQNPSCSPFALPPDKYDVWKRTTVNFNPRDMF